VEPLPGFKPAKPMVFAGLYPVNPPDLDRLKDAIQKLTMTDSGVSVQKESRLLVFACFLRLFHCLLIIVCACPSQNSDALGMGFRCGFLGVLHMEVFTQRLEQEYDLDVINTAPTVPYKSMLVRRRDAGHQFVDGSSAVKVRGQDEEITITNPSEYPEQTNILSVRVPL
jgi:translation elongation factor EF-4